jgi:hypothetical protein
VHLVLAASFVLGCAWAQRPPPGSSPTVPLPVDPFLRPELVEAVERASQAELDPKRGTGNAIEILNARKKELGSDQALTMGVDLRIAGTVLRSKFLHSNEFPEPERAVQALSTFSRLDIDDPNINYWVDRTLDKNPEAKKKLGKRGTWVIRGAILTRGSGFDRAQVAQAFQQSLKKVGVQFESVAAKEAAKVLTVSAEDAPHEGGNVAVKMALSLQSIEKGKIVWEQSLFRVEAAKDPGVALRSCLVWLSRIGGRDLFFRWLGENGLTALKDSTPKLITSPDREVAQQGAKKGGVSPVGSAQNVPLKVNLPKGREHEPPPPK